MWGSTRPRCCLSIGATSASWAEAGGGWSGRRQTYRTRALPAGLVRPSPVEPNVNEPGALRDVLHELIHQRDARQAGGWSVLAGFPRRAVLVLPDMCVRAVLLRLEDLPEGPEEQEALIRWRLGKERLFPLAGARIAWQTFSLDGRPVKGPQRVLAVATREEVVRQYESICEEVGIIPMEIDTASFRLFNLWALASGRPAAALQEDVLWVNVQDGGMTVLVFHGQRLAFIRSKPLATLTPPGETQTNESLDRLVEELLASVDLCAEGYPDLSVRRVILSGTEPGTMVARRLSEEVDLEVEELGWDQVAKAGWRAGAVEGAPGGMPAVAGLLGA